jgi:hypothetical protein
MGNKFSAAKHLPKYICKELIENAKGRKNFIIVFDWKNSAISTDDIFSISRIIMNHSRNNPTIKYIGSINYLKASPLLDSVVPEETVVIIHKKSFPDFNENDISKISLKGFVIIWYRN